MKLFHKIFLCFVIVFGITFQVAGYLLINYAYESAIEQEKRFAFQEFLYNKYILQSLLYTEPELLAGETERLSDAAKSFAVPIAIFGADKECMYSNMRVVPENLDFDEIEDEKISYQIICTEAESCILVHDYIAWSDSGVYLVTEADISAAVNSVNDMMSYFQRLYLVILCVGFPVIFLLTNFLAGPIKTVSRAAKRIAEGSYAERIEVTGRDEIGELAVDFNQMAEKIEEKVEKLSDLARQKEDFTANFAHELKTPLTSVIGYADMLYQRDLPREQVRSAAEYILNEGLRLEALSLKLMDLFVMEKQNFILEHMSVKETFDHLEEGLKSICQKYGVSLHIDVEEGQIGADYDLFATMFQNLVDNAGKADSEDIWIRGEREEKSYRILVRDNGTGIPPEELERITEAFYMVDKSRARRQHGAGLGLALVSKIVELHRADMKIESDGKMGTKVCLVFFE